MVDVLSENKKSCPKIWDRTYDSCGTTQIADKSAAYRHTDIRLFLNADNVAPNGSSARFALMSPFAGVCAAAIPPSAALLNAFTAATTLNHRFMVIINTLYNITAFKFCQGFFAAETIICVCIKKDPNQV